MGEELLSGGAMELLVGILILVVGAVFLIAINRLLSAQNRSGPVGSRTLAPRVPSQAEVHRVNSDSRSPKAVRGNSPGSLPTSGGTPGDHYWIPAGQEVRLHGLTIPGGMLYVGRGLKALAGWLSTEPALIDPGLPVKRSRPNWPASGLNYWPSYTEIDPMNRGVYLEWLAQGRKDPAVDIGYVFLFFYGLERRVLVDTQASEKAKSEAEGLLAEVERLLSIYGSNGSFKGYASNFLAVARLANGLVEVENLEPVLDHRGWGWEMPLSVRLGLGSLVGQGKPIPAVWALSWFFTSGQARLRTPAQRCTEEFRELFLTLYAKHFPEGGMKVRAGKTSFTLRYRPASRSLPEATLSVSGVRDVSRLTAPVRKLQELADEAMNSLDAYSRWIGRTDDRDSPAALALLPREIAWNHESPATQELVSWLSDLLGKGPTTLVPTEELVRRWPTKKEGMLAKREAEQLTGFFARFGMGIEPDVRWGGPILSRSREAVVFRLPAEGLTENQPGPEAAYEAATLLLHISAALSAADGEVSETEERHLLAHLEEALELPSTQKLRLQAHLTWLLNEPPGLAGLKKRIEPVELGDRHRLAQFLLTVAGADGRITVEELKLLQKVYPLLGLDAEAVTSDLHALMTGESTAADQPVTVQPGEPLDGFAIPKPRQEADAAPDVVLDMAKVRTMREQTRWSQEILSEVFAEDDEPVMTHEPVAPRGEDEPSVDGLSVSHSRLLLRLATKPFWSRIEVEQVCASLDLLPDGALEEINEAAFEKCGEPLLEGEDPVELDKEILKEMMA